MPDGKDDVGQEHDIENLDDAAIKAEEEGLKGKSEDEIRAQVIEQYELDEDDNSDLIDKLVKDKVADQKRLSTAIKQKRGWREKATKAPEKKEEIAPEKKKEDLKGSITDEDIDKKVDAKLVKRDLDSLDVSDELRREVKKFVEFHGVSVAEAMKDPYIKFKKNEEDEKVRAEEAAAGGKRRSQSSKQDFSSMGPKDFDLTTEEGRKGWDEYKNWLKTQ